MKTLTAGLTVISNDMFKFFHATGKTEFQDFKDYTSTQLHCAAEEVNEFIANYDPKNPGKEINADDVGDVIFACLGGVACFIPEEKFNPILELVVDVYEDIKAIVDPITLLEVQNNELLKALEDPEKNNSWLRMHGANKMIWFIASVLRLAPSVKVDALTAFEIVTENNLKKFDESLADAETSVALYSDKGIATIISEREGVFAILSAKDQTVKDKFYPNGKILKSYLWEEPSFQPAITE